MGLEIRVDARGGASPGAGGGSGGRGPCLCLQGRRPLAFLRSPPRRPGRVI